LQDEGVDMNIKPNILQVLNILAIILTIIINAVVEIIPVNGVTSADVSAYFPSLFTPPGYVFSIWSVIYTLLIVFMIFQVRSSQSDAPYLKTTSIFFVLGGIINTSWLILFHYAYEQPTIYAFTPILIGLFLVLMLYTYVKLGIGKSSVPRAEKLAVHLPISVYAGWVSLAVIANIASVLNVVVPGIPVATQELWTALVIIVALLITMLMLVIRHDFAYGLVVIWATVGIASIRGSIPLIFYAAVGSAIIVGLAILLLPLIAKKGFGEYYFLSS